MKQSEKFYVETTFLDLEKLSICLEKATALKTLDGKQFKYIPPFRYFAVKNGFVFGANYIDDKCVRNEYQILTNEYEILNVLDFVERCKQLYPSGWTVAINSLMGR